MNNTSILFSLFFSCVFCLSLHAQKSVNAGGGNIVEPEISIAYSIGQVFYEPIIYAGESLTPGVQQACEIAVITLLPKTSDGLQIQAYPNPADDYLLLSFPEYRAATHSLLLSDLTGKILAINEIKEELTRLEVHHLMPGIYFLVITDNEQVIQLFKIIKK
jgi:hypothetical protein